MLYTFSWYVLYTFSWYVPLTYIRHLCGTLRTRVMYTYVERSPRVSCPLGSNSCVLLQTALAEVSNHVVSRKVTVRLLFDNGSQRSFVTTNLRNALQLAVFVRNMWLMLWGLNLKIVETLSRTRSRRMCCRPCRIPDQVSKMPTRSAAVINVLVGRLRLQVPYLVG